MASEVIAYPNTLLMCCPTGDGAAAVVLVSDEKLKTLPREQQRRAVKVSASVLTSDPWTEGCQVQPDVNTLTRNAADAAYEASGVDPADLDLVELHDCFATAELRHYDNLRLCEAGGAGEWIDKGGPWRDGDIPVNVSGRAAVQGAPRSAPPAWPTCSRWPRTYVARPATVRCLTPRWAWPTSSASAPVAAYTSWSAPGFDQPLRVKRLH